MPENSQVLSQTPAHPGQEETRQQKSLIGDDNDDNDGDNNISTSSSTGLGCPEQSGDCSYEFCTVSFRCKTDS
jgi:hypothetical protein